MLNFFTKFSKSKTLFSIPSSTSLVCCSSLLLILVYCAVKVSNSIWWKPKKLEKKLKLQGLTGTPYKLLVGDMKEYIRLITEAWSKPINLNHDIVARVDPFTLQTVQNHGKVSYFWAGTTPRVVVKDPELVKEVLLNKLGHFGKPPLNALILVLTKGLSTLEGEDWARHRRVINPAFHFDRLKEMVPMFSISCMEMIESWKRMVGVEGTCEVDVWPELHKLVADIISRALFGSSFEEGKKIFELQNEQMALTLEAMQTLYIPGFRFVPTEKNQRRKRLYREIKSLIRDIIQKKESSMRTGNAKNCDLLDILLQSNNENNVPEITSSRNDNQLTIEEVIEECKQFYLAGKETTGSLLAWIMIVLAMHPDWQDKAREEVLRVCKNKEPDFESISHLKIVAMIIYEVLRLYPPAIASYQHTYKETKIGDILLPPGVDVTLPTLLIHHDRDLWGDDAQEFKPERFSEGVSKASRVGGTAFLPFSWGPRICIGQNFALIEAKMALSMILQHFSFKLSPSYTHAPHTILILQPQHGAQIMLRRL